LYSLVHFWIVLLLLFGFIHLDFWLLTGTHRTLRATYPTISESHLSPFHSLSKLQYLCFYLSPLFLYVSEPLHYPLILRIGAVNTTQSCYSRRPGGGPVTLARPHRPSRPWNLSLEPKDRKTETAGAATPGQQQALLALPSCPGLNAISSTKPSLACSLIWV